MSTLDDSSFFKLALECVSWEILDTSVSGDMLKYNLVINMN